MKAALISKYADKLKKAPAKKPVEEMDELMSVEEEPGDEEMELGGAVGAEAPAAPAGDLTALSDDELMQELMRRRKGAAKPSAMAMEEEEVEL